MNAGDIKPNEIQEKEHTHTFPTVCRHLNSTRTLSELNIEIQSHHPLKHSMAFSLLHFEAFHCFEFSLETSLDVMHTAYGQPLPTCVHIPRSKSKYITRDYSAFAKPKANSRNQKSKSNTSIECISFVIEFMLRVPSQCILYTLHIHKMKVNRTKNNKCSVCYINCEKY